MSSARERLFMLNNHIQHTPNDKLIPQFPELRKHERDQYFNRVSPYLNGRPMASPHGSRPSSPFQFNPASAEATDHNLVMIPGPIEFSSGVLEAMSIPSQAHTSPEFVSTFQQALKKLRILFGNSKTNGGQPFIISGSGTLGWDILGGNLIEENDDVLVISTGFFSNGLAEALGVYGARVTKLEAEVGEGVSETLIAQELQSKNYRLITLTHTDTSTGVLTDIETISKLVKKLSPSTLIAVDAVCSAGVEEVRFDSWGLDFVLTASQKALGVPAGLSVLMVSERAIHKSLKRSKPSSYFCNLNKWYPVMKNYEEGKASYFATPSIQLVTALNVSLDEILGDLTKLDHTTGFTTHLIERFDTHKKVALSLREKLAKLGLKFVANSSTSANGMTAVYLPAGITTPELLKLLAQDHIVLSGGIHPKIATKYFRIGHMGVSALDSSRGDVERVIEGIVKVLKGL